jgi:2-oxo-3-hexenedioate decarboxylase
VTTTPDAARSLRTARLTGVLRRPFTDTHPELDERWGYDVQDLDRADRLAAGENLVGAKLGLTSRAK